MKKALSIALIAVTLFSFTGCAKQSKEPPVADIISKIKTDITLPEMAEIQTADIPNFINVTVDNIEESAYLMAGDGISADEVLIVKLKKDSDTKVFTDAFETRKKIQAELFEPYAPGEMPKIENAVIKSEGQYVILAITSENDKVKKIFADAI